MEFGRYVIADNATEAFDEWYHILSEQAKAGWVQDSRDGDVVGEVITAITVINDPTRAVQQGLGKIV